METLGKDLKRYLGEKLDERDFLNYCAVNKGMCNDESYKLYLLNKYPDIRDKIILDKEEHYGNKTWKQYFLMFVYYKSILNNVFTEEDQRNFLDFFGGDIIKYETVSKMKDRVERLVDFKGGMGFFVLIKSGEGNLEGVKFGISRIKDFSDDTFWIGFSIKAAEDGGYTEIVKYLEKFVKK